MNKAIRNLHLDTIKGILITLVVFGHIIESHIDKPLELGIYNTIYSFHMPLFVLISGYFFNPFSSVKKNLINSLHLFETYLVFQTINLILMWKGGGHITPMSIFLPSWTLWYLLALAAWRVMTTIGSKIIPRQNFFVIIFTVAIIVSIFAGFIPLSAEFSVQRIFYYYPIFLIGVLIRIKGLELTLIESKTPIIGGGILLTISILVLLFSYTDITFDNIRFGFFGYRSYETPADIYKKLGFMIIGISLSLILFTTIRTIKLFAIIGTCTLPIYIMHVFCVRFLNRHFIDKGLLSEHILALAAYTAIIIAGVYIICKNKWFSYITNPISKSISLLSDKV